MVDVQAIVREQWRDCCRCPGVGGLGGGVPAPQLSRGQVWVHSGPTPSTHPISTVCSELESRRAHCCECFVCYTFLLFT